MAQVKQSLHIQKKQYRQLRQILQASRFWQEYHKTMNQVLNYRFKVDLRKISLNGSG